MKYFLILLTLLLGCATPIPNATSVVSPDWANWVNGKKFYFYHQVKNMDVNEVVNLALSVGKNPIVIDKVLVKGSMDKLYWQWRRDGVVDRLQPDNIPEIPANETIQSSSDSLLFVLPTASGWTAVTQTVALYGQPTNITGKSRLNEILVSEKLVFKANTTHLLYLKNADDSPPDLDILINFFVM